MAYKKVKRIVRRYAQKAGSALKKRYFKGKGYSRPKLVQIAKDVSMLKGMMNAEKKRFEVSITDGSVGQVNATASGHYLYDMTPVLSQGVGFNQRTGNSVKLTSLYCDFQFIGQVNQVGPTRVKIELVKVVGQPFSTVSSILGKYIEPTSFVTGANVYDLNSPRDPDFFKNYIVMKRRYVTLQSDSISGQTMIKRIKFGLTKMEHHIRYDNNLPDVSMGQFFLIITADRGNVNSATISTVGGVPDIAVNTGVAFRSEFTYYYYDN